MIGGDFEAVLKAAQAGDEAAFSLLVRDAQPSLLRYLRVVSATEAEDVAGDTWVTVVRGLRRFRGDESAWRAWLFATARRRAVEEGRRRARPPATAPWDAAELPDSGHLDPADVTLANLGLEEAVQAIRRLPAAQAEVLMLRLVGGLSTAAVADIVGSSPGAVRVAAHRALRKVAAELSAAVTL